MADNLIALPRRRAAAALILTLALVGPPQAAAAIRTGGAIASVQLGYSMKHVRHVLGDPHRVIPPDWVFGKPLDGQVGFNHHDRVNDIWTTSRRERTRRGIGPGSSLAAMRRRYPKARCYHNAGRWSLLCVLRSHRHGTLVKADFLFRKRLSKVDIFLAPPPAKIEPS